MNTILTDDELPPLQPQDHPEPHSFAWTEQEMRAIRARDRLVEAAVLAKLREQEPVAYGMPDTQLGRKHRLMMVRLDKGQDGCTLPLYAAPLPAVVQVPDGWKLVPVEPTPEMLKAAKDSTWIGGHYSFMAYRAMLAAAPQQPAPQPLTPEQRARLIDQAGDICDGLSTDDFADELITLVERAHGIGKEQS